MDWLNAFATLLAAFGGVYGAHQLEHRARRAEESTRQREAVNRALFALIHYWNRLVSIDKDILQPARQSPDRWFVMPANVDPGDPTPPHPDPDGRLQFLLGDGEHADLYARIMLQEQRYRTYQFLLQHRTDLLEHAWRKLTIAGIPMGSSIPETQLMQVVGQDLVKKLKVVGEGLYEQFDQNIRSFEKTIGELREEALKVFPGQSFISFERIERANSK